MKKGHRGLVFPSKRNNLIWQVGLHLMIFDKEILKKIIPKINLNDYLSYKNFDAFAFLHNHIVIPLELEIAKEPVEDEIYYYEDYDFFNMSDDKDMKYMISSPDGYIDTLKIFFYSVDENLKIKPSDSVFVEMQCISNTSYIYYNTLDQQSGAGPGGGTAPSNPPSNIEGGALGIFSAHTVQRKAIKIR